jgi:neopullulanase
MNGARSGLCVSLASAFAVAMAACGGGGPGTGDNPPHDAGGDRAALDASVHDGSGPPPPDAPVDVSHEVSTAECMTTFSYTPPPGSTPTSVAVTGEWNAFATPGVTMVGPDSKGSYRALVPLEPGLVAYKLIVDGTFELDPAESLEKYVSGIANSAVNVTDCHLPTLSVASNHASRTSKDHGEYKATIAFTPGEGAPVLNPKAVKVTLRKDQVTSDVSAVTTTASTIGLDIKDLADGKYTAFVDASDYGGQKATPLRLVFWIEAESFVWQDALLYMAVTDRFKDGDLSNDAPPTSGVDPREDFQGGDFQGVTAKIKDGTFDALGVRALWLSPFNTNPSDAWVASDNVHMTMGYHGYWPIKAREVDARFGGEAALKDMVIAAHAHGIRVVADMVIQHVHQEHEYVTSHPDWFSTGCVCGTSGCDWTVDRLTCIFSTYLPNVNWENPDAAAQWQADSIWWADTFDLDGFRMDAVKQVPDVAVTNLTWAMRREFEPSGTEFFMTGETAMGWNGGPDNATGLADNADQYSLINEYMGPTRLDGQFDFPLYYAVPLNDFASNTYGLDEADYWTQASGWEYVPGSLMSPYIGSEDTARFITIASDPANAYNQWAGIATAPTSALPYEQLRMAMSWLLTVPGVPLVYYGDEYGQWGGVDPNNRVMWWGDGVLNANEQATLGYVQKLGTARKKLVALRRGEYVPILSNPSTLLFGRQDAAGDIALVALSNVAQTFTAALPLSMPLSDGTKLSDQLGGSDVVVSGGTVTVTLGALGAAILAP